MHFEGLLTIRFWPILASLPKLKVIFHRIVKPQRCLSICDVPEDNMILECAEEACANYIGTGDNDLLRPACHGKTPIVTPAGFVREFLDADQLKGFTFKSICSGSRSKGRTDTECLKCF
jgi:hypothetical protein